MIYRLQKVFLFTLFLLGFFEVRGQDNLYYKRLGTDQGLSQTTVMNIAQDKFGFMWFATQQGLNLFDGYKFKVFLPEEGKNSIISSHLFCLAPDTNGDIWIGTDVGISKYDRIKDKFTNYTHKKDDNTSITPGRVTALFHDSHRRLWVANENGLSYMDKKTGIFRHYPYVVFKNQKIKVSSINHIDEGANGDIYFSAPFEGFFRMNKNGHIIDWWSKFENESDPSPHNVINSSVLDFLFDKDGNLWLCTVIGLERLNLKTGQKKIWQNDPNDIHSISSNNVARIYQDHSGNIWVGTDAGLNLYNKKNENFKVYLKSDYNLQSIGGNNIECLYEDKQGHMWIGTYDGGATGMFLQQPAFETYSHHSEDPNSLSNNAVNAFLVDKDKTLWVGTNTGGLNRFDPETKNFKHYMYDPKNPKTSLTSNVVLSLAQDGNGKIWVTTPSDGYNSLDPKTGKCIQYVYSNDHPGIPSSGPVFSVNYDEKNNCIWLGTFGEGLNKMDLTVEKFERFSPKSKEEGNEASDFIITASQLDKDGIVWIGSLQGFASFNTQTHQFKVWNVDRSIKHGMNSDKLNSISLSDNLVWFGTDMGVHFYDKKTGNFRYFTTKDGLSDDLINSVETDKNGNVWVATNRGLSCIIKPSVGFIAEKNNSEQPVVIKNYDVMDGIQGNEFNSNASYIDRLNNIYFGGVNGFTIVHPDLLKDNIIIPPVYLTDFMLFNRSISPDDTLHLFNKTFTFADKVNLRNNQNVFSISFTALNYKNPERIIYQYRMDGFDDNWVTVGADKRFANYTNLDPASYKFRVRASMDGIHWSEKEATVDIEINPPFWKTIPFRAATLIFLVLAIVASVRFYLEREFKKKLTILERQQEVARIRGRIARDIHDNIGAELTRISLLTEVAKIENPGINHTSFTKLSDASREIVGQLGEIVWSVNPLHDNLVSMLSYMRNYILHFLEDTTVHYEIDITEEVPEMNIHPELRRNLFLILKEALNNSIKYAEAKNIFVSFLITGDNYVMKIVDDGKGMDMAVKPTGNGLINMQNRMDNVGGELHVLSYLGKGTTIVAEGKLF